MRVEILEWITQGQPFGRGKGTFLLQTDDDILQLEREYPPKGKAVNGSIAVIWSTGATLALFDTGWEIGG